MERFTQILSREDYRQHLNKIAACEVDRVYCKHTLEHFFDVARIAYVMRFERHITLSKDVIYAAALLHDIGRHLQYTESIPHAMASSEIAKKILPEVGYTLEETRMICGAIEKHSSGHHLETHLDHLLFEADKASRMCYTCHSVKSCKNFLETIPVLPSY